MYIYTYTIYIYTHTHHTHTRIYIYTPYICIYIYTLYIYTHLILYIHIHTPYIPRWNFIGAQTVDKHRFKRLLGALVFRPGTARVFRRKNSSLGGSLNLCSLLQSQLRQFSRQWNPTGASPGIALIVVPAVRKPLQVFLQQFQKRIRRKLSTWPTVWGWLISCRTITAPMLNFRCF